MATRLIVNADDFGMTPGVNRTVSELHAAGALTSATLMACGEAFTDAVEIAKMHPSLGVGCHVVLVDGLPTAPAGEAESLLARNGRLSDSMLDFAIAVQTRYVRASDIERETAAQIARLQDAGIAVSHVDTHKHAHLLPRVARAVMRGARSRDVTRIRNPFEPRWASDLSPTPMSRKLPFRLLHTLRGAFLKTLRDVGMRTTDGSIGLIATGWLDADLVRRLTEALPAGDYELVCHPGYQDAELDRVRTRLRATREVERDALLSVIPYVQPERVRLTSFAEL